MYNNSEKRQTGTRGDTACEHLHPRRKVKQKPPIINKNSKSSLQRSQTRKSTGENRHCGNSERQEDARNEKRAQRGQETRKELQGMGAWMTLHGRA